MKCVVIEKPRQVVLTERELPALQKGFARIKVKAAAICATDLEVVDGNIPANYPLTPGHEWSGVVESVADDRYSAWIGKRVTGSNDVTYGVCEACRSGNWRYCKEFQEIGFKRNGAYAEYVDVPAYGLVELPDDLPFEHAALAEPMGVALGTWEKLDPKFGGTCLIYGAGSIGLCCLAVKEEDIFAAMKKYHPEGTDYIIEATGIEECITNSFKLCKKGGYVALAGYGRGKNMSIRIDDIHVNNLHVVGAGNNWNQHKKAVQMMADGLVDMTPFVTEILSLDEYQKGLDDARNRPIGFVKAIFKFD